MNQSESSAEQKQPKKIIPWHPLFNRWLKGTLTPVDVDYNDEVYATSEPVEIDAVLSHVGPTWSQQQKALLPDGIRNRRMRHHLLEFKITESVNMDAIEQAFCYDYLYRKSQNLSRSQLQTYMISAKTPHAATLEKWGYAETRYPGVYVSAQAVFNRITILILNKLRDVPHNQYFRLFASQKKVRRSAMQYLIKEHERAMLADRGANSPDERDSENRLALNSEQLREKWTVLFALRRIYELEGIKMDIEMTLEDVMEMGREEYRRNIIERFPAEERMAGLEPKDVVSELEPKDRVAGLEPEEIVEALEPGDVVRLMQAIEHFLANQNIVVPTEEDESEPEGLVEDSLAAD